MATWREITDPEEAAVWAAMWEDSESALIADFRSDALPFASSQARLIGRFGVVRVAHVEYGRMHVRFWVTRQSGEDLTLWRKARNEWSDLETLHEDDVYDARHYRSIYLPREAEGVREW